MEQRVKIQGQRFLIIGDSLTHHGADAAPQIWDVNQGSSRQSNAPGDLLASMLYERGAVVRTDAKVGRSANSFWNSEPAADLIASDLQFAPNVVIVFLGTNDLGLTMSIDQGAMAKIRDAFKGIPGIQIWAVGPPAFANVVYQQQADDIYTMLVNVFGADHVVDARQLTTTMNRASDGVHFSTNGAQDFANKLLLAFQSIPDPVAVVASAGMKPAVKVAIAAVGLGILGAAGWFIYSRMSARAALGDGEGDGQEHDDLEDGNWDDDYVPKKRELGRVDEKLIERVTSMVSFRVPVEDIHDTLVAQGYEEEDIYLAYRAAQQRVKDYDMNGFGRLGPKMLANGSVAEEPITTASAGQQLNHFYSIGEDAIETGQWQQAEAIMKQARELTRKHKAIHFSTYTFWSLKPERMQGKKMPTYSEAQRSILADLAANGWKVERKLRIPHATSPSGVTRLWFKPQAVWYTALDDAANPASRHDFKNARTINYYLDIRKLPGARFRHWWMVPELN